MFIVRIIIFCSLFFVIFSMPKLKNKKSTSGSYLFGIPVVLGLCLALITFLKIFIFYKLLLFLITAFLGISALWLASGIFKKGK